MLTITVPDGDGGVTDDELNQFSFTGRVEGEVKTLISLHNTVVSDENVHTVHSGFTVNSNNTVIGGCKINSICVKGKWSTILDVQCFSLQLTMLTNYTM